MDFIKNTLKRSYNFNPIDWLSLGKINKKLADAPDIITNEPAVALVWFSYANDINLLTASLKSVSHFVADGIATLVVVQDCAAPFSAAQQQQLTKAAAAPIHFIDSSQPLSWAGVSTISSELEAFYDIFTRLKASWIIKLDSDTLMFSHRLVQKLHRMNETIPLFIGQSAKKLYKNNPTLAKTDWAQGGCYCVNQHAFNAIKRNLLINATLETLKVIPLSLKYLPEDVFFTQLMQLGRVKILYWRFHYPVWLRDDLHAPPLLSAMHSFSVLHFEGVKQAQTKVLNEMINAPSLEDYLNAQWQRKQVTRIGPVERYLQRFVGKDKVYFLLNPGNGGDCLIALGTFHLLNKLNIHYQAVTDVTQIPDHSRVILSGGGNFNHIYTHIRSALENLHRRSTEVVLLPHTVSDNDALICSLGDNVTLFAREQVSYDYLKSLDTDAHIDLDNDMAFHIDKSQLGHYSLAQMVVDTGKSLFCVNADIAARHGVSTPREMLKALLFTLKLYSQRQPEGLFFRKDTESAKEVLPKHSIDISSVYNLGVQNEELCRKVVCRMFHSVERFERVQTDRLHVAIACALNDSPAVLHANNYHKSQSVYQYSLAPHYKSIDFLAAN